MNEPAKKRVMRTGPAEPLMVEPSPPLVCGRCRRVLNEMGNCDGPSCPRRVARMDRR